MAAPRSKWMLFLLAFCSFALVLSVSHPASAQEEHPYDLLIVCNRGIKDNIDIAMVRDLFLRRRLAWPSGTSVVPVHARRGSRLRTEFQRRVLSMSDKDEVDFWEKAKIMHAFTPPTEFPEPLRAVFRLTGGLGYVFRAQYKEGVSRVVVVLPADSEAKKLVVEP